MRKQTIIVAISILVILIIFSAVFIVLTGPEETEDIKGIYENLYLEWRDTVQYELDNGKSWVFGDRILLEKLSIDIDANIDFLRNRLQKDMFCVLILENGLKLPENVDTSNMGLHEKQKIWLENLDSVKR